jgi:hypothetical protein
MLSKDGVALVLCFMGMRILNSRAQVIGLLEAARKQLVNIAAYYKKGCRFKLNHAEIVDNSHLIASSIDK